MAPSGDYSVLRAVIILVLSFALPLLVTLYSDQLSTRLAALHHLSKSSAKTNFDNATLGSSPILASEQNEHASCLLRELRRDTGRWNSNHPRYRLMNSMKAYMRYGEERTAELDIWRKRYKKLSRNQKSTIERTIGYTNKLNTVEDLMLKNAELAESILDYSLSYYGVTRSELEAFVHDTSNGTTKQMGNTLYSMKHFVRDWSDSGAHEREATYPCILEAIHKAFPARSSSEPVRVLVPGSGLGRLGHEIASLGDFQVTLNEFSFSMNMAYHYLATLDTSRGATIYPYVDWWSHRATTAHLVRPVSFPDNANLLKRSQVSLVEGEFTTALTSHEGTYDVLVSHFFIDTATNILSYLETIHAMLKPGGIWINFGPLLYGTMPALQLSLDEVIAMAESLGLELETSSDSCGESMEFDGRVRGAHVPYAYDTESLSRNAYLAQHWIAKKRQ